MVRLTQQAGWMEGEGVGWWVGEGEGLSRGVDRPLCQQVGECGAGGGVCMRACFCASVLVRACVHALVCVCVCVWCVCVWGGGAPACGDVPPCPALPVGGQPDCPAGGGPQ